MRTAPEATSALCHLLRTHSRAALLPPPRMTVDQWADTYRILGPEGNAIPGPWRTSTQEVARGPMRAITEPGVRTMSVMSCTQIMKALDINTPIPTTSGWKLMGDIQVGDILFDENGAQTKVIKATEILVGRQCYRVVFSDGEEVVCDAGHLWRVDDNRDRNTTQETRVVETSEIAATFKNKFGRNRYAIPVAGQIEMPAADLPVPPYTMGAWLGDGMTNRAAITLHEDDDELLMHMMDEGVFPDVLARTETGVLTVTIDFACRNRLLCPRGHDMLELGQGGGAVAYCSECKRQQARRKNHGIPCDPRCPYLESLGVKLRALGVCGPDAEKRIPDIYKFASADQRIALLQGLMDTDGSISEKFARPSFTTTLPGLRDDFMELARGLGFKPTAHEVQTTCKYKGEIVRGIAWQIGFTAYSDRPVFKLSRKRNRMRGEEGCRVSETKRRRIVDVQEVESRPVRCVGVDSPNHLFLCGKGFIPTHNTSVLENAFGYFAHLDPCPILFVQPKEDAVQTFSKKKISPLIRHSPVLRDLVRDAADRDGKSTQAYKKFPGGDLLITAAGSPTNLAMISIRVVGLDEVDKYSTTPEGDPILLAEERMSSFVANSLSIRTCSPTTKEGSISKSYAGSDQRRPYVRCPHCDHEQVLKWHQVQWDKDEDGNHQAETARVYCEGCGAGWTDRERHHAIRTTIQWRQTRKFRCCGEDQDPQVTRLWDWDDEHLIGRALCRHCGKRAVSNRHAGYWASKLYSCTQTVSELVYKWINVQDDVEQLRFFINTQLAEEYEERGQKLDDGVLMSRRESYSGIIPDDSSLLVCSVDVQDNRLEALIVSYGIDECSSVIDHVVIPGDPGQGHVWLELDKLLKTPVSRWDGKTFHIQATTIDTGGHHAQRVYEFAAARAGRRVWAIKGASERNGQRSPVWPSKVSMSKTGKTFYIVGTNAAKDQIHARLKIESHGPGYIRFGQNLEKDFFEQLTAEKLVTVHERGEYRRYWKNPERKRNEAWDLICYAYAALCGLKATGLRLNSFVAQRAPVGSVTTAPAAGPGFASATSPVLSSTHDVDNSDRRGSSPSARSPDIGPSPKGVAPRDGQPARPADSSAAGPAPSPQPPPPAPAPKAAKRRAGPRFVMGMR